MDPEVHYYKLFKATTAFIMDVDGVLTDGSVLLTDSGDELRTMNIRDGYALQLAIKRGFSIVVISGGRSEGVVRRLNRLGIKNIAGGVDDKPMALMQIADALKIDLTTSVYIGDDIPDLEVMQLCGIPCCPSDAASEVIDISKYVSPWAGGKGCVRDILEKVMKLQSKW
ncbi:MAG: HAD hydrolase family protein [Chitinophagales bacterium]|jgi:3-deoxy-D-manno-octulosonate 8-phosphate phosphatase (KDO 8-P phosphatase)|nr:HAD hydrolase family protein [Chitinophagales bacterium]